MTRFLLGVTLLVSVNVRAAVEVTFARVGQESIDSGTALEVTVRSTDAIAREVRPIYLEVPSDLLFGARPKGDGSGVATLQTSETDTKDLDAGGTITQTVYLAPLSLRETLSPRALFFRSAEYQIYSIVGYSASLTTPLTQIRQKHSIRVTGPLLGIIAGGFIGVMLAVLFTWVFAKSQGTPAAPWKQQAFIIATGIVTVSIVALIRYVDDTLLKTLGIAFAIYDFRGGILLGLLFQPIAKKLAELLLGDNREAPKPKARRP